MLQGLDFSWHWNPIIVISLLLLCLLYVVAIRLARRYKPEETLPSYRIIAFASAIILIALVLLTPLDTIARTQLFAAHMIQAVTLTTLCAPLLLVACPDWLLQPLIDQPVWRSFQPTIISREFAPVRSQLNEAIEAGKKAVELRPNDQIGWTSLSLFYNRAGNIEEAEAAGTKAKILSWGGKIAKE